MKELVLFGAGGFAREVLQIVEDLNEIRPTWDFLGFLDSDPAHHGAELHDCPVPGDASWLKERPGVSVVVAIGGTATSP